MTRVLLLQRLSESFGDWWSQTTTGAGSTTTTVDTKLAQLSADDDFCLGWYIRKVATDETRRITGSYTASTNTITHAAFPLAIGNGNTYELHRLDPTQKHNAINRAAVLTFPGTGMSRGLYLPVRDESIVIDNLLTNSDIESTIVAGAHPSWTNGGAGVTVSTETSIVRHGSQSAKIVAGGGAAGTMSQSFGTVNINQVNNQTAYFEAWVYATAASIARIRLSFDGGSTFTSNAYHSGNSDWEYQKLAVTVPTTATGITAYFEAAAGGTAYFDAAWGGVAPVYKYTVPSSIVRGPFQVLMQADELYPEGPYYPIHSGYGPIAGRRLRLIGMNLLSQPTTDAGTVEIDTNQAEYYLAEAAQWLYRSMRQGGSQMERDYVSSLRGEWEQDSARWQKEGLTMANLGAALTYGTWKVEDDSSGHYLMFQQRRGIWGGWPW